MEYQIDQTKWLSHMYWKTKDFNVFRRNNRELKLKYSDEIILTFLKSIYINLVVQNHNVDFDKINECFVIETQIYPFVNLLKKLLCELNLTDIYLYTQQIFSLNNIYEEILSICCGLNTHMLNDACDNTRLCEFVHRCWCSIYSTNDININPEILNLDVCFDSLDQITKNSIKEKIYIVQNLIY